MIEHLSKYIHEVWCNWMEYQLPKVIENPDNELISGKMKCYDADEFGNTTREVKCETCKNTGIYIPKSEA